MMSPGRLAEYAEIAKAMEAAMMAAQSKKNPILRYEYPMYKDGDRIAAKYRGTGKFTKSEIHEPLSRESIFAVDTESTLKAGTLRTDLIPIAFFDEKIVIDIEDPDPRSPLERFLEKVVSKYGVALGKHSDTVQRPKVTKEQRERRRDSTTGRDGRRVKVPITVCVWFNLPYDIGRLFSDREQLRKIYSGADSYRMKISDRFEIEWVRYIDTSAPQFSWMIRDYENRLIVRLIGVDLTGYWKCSLESALSSVGLKGKDDIESVVKDVHDRAFETFTSEEKEARKSYAIHDSERTLELFHATVDMLCQVDLRVVRKTGMIPPSAPGAAARIMFQKAFDLHPGIKSWNRPPFFADRLGALSYYGGRAAAPFPGVHREVVTVDLKSAYPAAMTMLPDPVTAVYHEVEPCDFDVNNYIGKWGVLQITGKSLDPIYPAFRIHEDNRLRYVTGKFTNLYVTIPEIIVGFLRGALQIDRVHGGVIIEGDSDKSFFRKFVLDLYDMKEKHGKTALGNFAKLLMNSAYGKTVEVNAKELRWEETLPVPNFKKYQQLIARSMLTLATSDGPVDPDLIFAGEGGATAINERRYTILLPICRSDCPPERRVELYSDFLMEILGDPKELVPLKQFLSTAKSYTVGAYFIPLFGSQITGFVCAQLGALSSALRAYVMDTDSAHVKWPEGDPMDSPQALNYFRLMKMAGYVAPRFGGEKIAGTTLGMWMAESPKPSEESIICRPKRYSHKYVLKPGEKPAGKTCWTFGKKAESGESVDPFEFKEGWTIEYKNATHGMSKYTTPEADAAAKDTRLSKRDREAKANFMRAHAVHEAMRVMVYGERVEYQTKKTPRKGRTSARIGGVVGEFVSNKVVVTNAPVTGTRKRKDGWMEWEEMK